MTFAALELPDHLRDMAKFPLATGLRRLNVMLLQWSQIGMNKKLAWIYPDQAKSRKAIGVPLGETAIEFLQRRLGIHLHYVLPSETSSNGCYDKGMV
ncbi:site-specific integrase [Acidithiobacillus ferrooxidans]|uniref:site-specific integrase n=1 Tax=Acidithiobacillus ferrooxidans TaxID=920 RepID=UPI0021F81972|nr:site-specific integrase [Acidithiobacillus ferrooxidans]